MQRLFHDDPASLIKDHFRALGNGPPPDPDAPIKADRKQAFADYAQALRLGPAHVETYRSRARAYFEQKDFDHGIADLATVVCLRPDDPQVYCDRAEAYYQRGRQARRTYFRRHSLLDTHAEDFRRAIADYTEALRLKPGDTATYCKRAEMYLQSDENGKAIADCNEMMRLQPNDRKDAYHFRALAYRNSKDYDRAIADCTELIRLCSRDPEGKRWVGERASLYETKGDKEHALADYTEAIHLQPDDAIRYTIRAEFFVRTRAFDQALADYAEAIRLENKRENSRYNVGHLYGQRAWVYLWKKDFDAAVKECTKAIEYYPCEGDLRAGRALLHVLRGERDLVLADGQAAAERYEFRHNRRALRAALLLLQGEFRQAIADFGPRGKRSQGIEGYGIPASVP